MGSKVCEGSGLVNLVFLPVGGPSSGEFWLSIKGLFVPKFTDREQAWAGGGGPPLVVGDPSRIQGQRVSSIIKDKKKVPSKITCVDFPDIASKFLLRNCAAPFLKLGSKRFAR